MKLNKKSNNHYTLKISKKEWLMLGMFQKWIPNIVSIAKSKQKKIIKIAQTQNITENEIINVIRNSVSCAYPSAFVLKKNDEIINEQQAKEAIINAFVELVNKDANFNLTKKSPSFREGFMTFLIQYIIQFV